MADKLRYRIIDEPRPGALARLAMPPILPLFAFMLFAPVGIVLILVNALALRGATMGREMMVAALGGILRMPAVFWLHDIGPEIVVPWLVKYLTVIPIGLSLWCGYKVFVWQSATHELMKYFKSGGRS